MKGGSSTPTQPIKAEVKVSSETVEETKVKVDCEACEQPGITG